MSRIESAMHRPQLEFYRYPTKQKINHQMQMTKLIPTLTTEQQKSITELYATLLEGVAKVNAMQYGFFNYEQFEACFKEEVDSVARTLITKLNEIIKTGNDNPNTHLAEMTVTAIGESCRLN